MALLLTRAAGAGDTIVAAPGLGASELCYFRLLQLSDGSEARITEPGCELLAVVLSGRVRVRVGESDFGPVGSRADIWSGAADSVYAGTGAEIRLAAGDGQAEVAIAGARCEGRFGPFRIAPQEVEMVEVGSAATHSRRRIFHILGQNAAGRAGRLLVSELYADPGCWSGYPPHKHDTERPPEETEFEEIYHYRFRPESGFGAQFSYGEDLPPRVVRTRHRDTFVVDRGYHPTVTSPGHEGYIFTILAGRHQRSLIQYFEPEHRHLMSAIPGIQAMRDKFK